MLFSNQKRTDITNRALNYIGLSPIENLYNGSSEREISARICFSSALETILSTMRYSFSEVAIPLVKYTDDKSGYYIPANLVRIIGIKSCCGCCCCDEESYLHDPFKIIKFTYGRIYIASALCSICNCCDPILIYTTFDFPAGLMTPAFERSVTFMLAHDLSLRFSSDINKQRHLMDESERWLIQAKSIETEDHDQPSNPCKRPFTSVRGTL